MRGSEFDLWHEKYIYICIFGMQKEGLGKISFLFVNSALGNKHGHGHLFWNREANYD